MSLATVASRAVIGIEALPVTVETHLSNGLPGFNIVGLPETAVRESKERVRSAILNSGLDFPERRITVNLAPADLPKAGGQFDFAIAISILLASGQVPGAELGDVEIMGELALNGTLRRISGAVPALVAARQSARDLILPSENLAELQLVNYARGRCSGTLLECVDHLHSGKPLPGVDSIGKPLEANTPPAFLPIKGQLMAQRAVQIAAAGCHNLLMIGPPGCGKTMLAQNLKKLLPPLSQDEAMEVAAIRSISQSKINLQHALERPLRAPHHSATHVALVGGGSRANPGEVTLAHRGILFLDEFSEFKPSALDALRESLETGEVTISRANYRVSYPASFQLIAAMNPCPCGFASDPKRECRCSPDKVSRYLSKVSGPLLDRIDLVVEMSSLSHAELLQQETGACGDPQAQWQQARARVRQCVARQLSRAGQLNSALQGSDLDRYAELNGDLRRLLAGAMEELALSARAVHRIIKLALTIADYEEANSIGEEHLLEAIAYRRSPGLRRLGMV